MADRVSGVLFYNTSIKKQIIDDLPAGRQVETPADYRSFIFCTANKTPVCSPPWRIGYPEFYFLIEIGRFPSGRAFRSAWHFASIANAIST